MSVAKRAESKQLSKLTEKVGTGATPLGGSEVYVSEGIPLIRSKNVHFGGIKPEGLARLQDEHAAELEYATVASDDVLLNITGASIGRVTVTPAWLDGARVNQHVCIIRPTEELHPKYLAYWLSAPEQQREIFETEAGATRQALTKGKIESFEVPVPNYDVQEQIVARLDDLTARADRVGEQLESIPPLVDKFKKSLLADAFSGELTREWRNNNPDVEPASDLLERIRPERRRRWVENYAADLADRARKRAEKKGEPFTEEDWQAYYEKKIPQGKDRYEEPEPVDPDAEDLPEIPETWEWVRLGLVAEVQGGIQKTPERTPHENPCPYLRVANVGKGELDLEDVKDFELFEGDLEKYGLEAGDLLIVEGNGSLSQIGRMAIWHGEISPCVHQNHIIRARPLPGVNPETLMLFWNSPLGRKRVRSAAKTSSGLYTLSKTKVESLPVTLPPRNEQAQIRERVTDRETGSKRAKRRTNDALERLSKLRSAVLEDVFAVNECG